MKPLARTSASVVLISLLLIYLAILIALLILHGNAVSMTSGSMEPALARGSLLLVTKTEPGRLQVGDIITFESQHDSTNVSRVIGVITSDSQLLFRTKADANESLDLEFVGEADIQGVIGFHVPYLGVFLEYSASLAGKFVLLAPILVVLAFLLILNRRKIARASSSNNQ